MIPPKSPTSLLWAFELRRQHMSVALRIDALEAALRQRNDDTHIRSVLEEVRQDVRELARRIGDVEANVDALRKLENARTVEDEGREQEAETGGVFGTKMVNGTFILLAAFIGMQRYLIASCGEVSLGQPDSQPTSVGDEDSGARRIVSKQDFLFDEVDALKQGERTWIEYVTCAEDILERAPAQWERYIVESFVEGIANDEHKDLIANVLTEDGYTWKRLSAAVQTIDNREVGRGGRGLSYLRIT